jgi:hypothetical protein
MTSKRWWETTKSGTGMATACSPNATAIPTISAMVSAISDGVAELAA